MNLHELTAAARDLCGTATAETSDAHPEYGRGMVELITYAAGLPMETGGQAVAEAIGLDWDALHPPPPVVAAPVPLALHRNGGGR